jgi:hypothetical protein
MTRPPVRLFLLCAALAVWLLPAATARAGLYYGAAGAQFVSIDGATGVATLINSNVGMSISALAWDSTAKVLYGTASTGSGTPFFTVNTTTGALNVISNDIGPNVVSLDFDDSTQTLYAAAFGGGVPQRFGTIDLGTGAFTTINASAGHDIDSIAFGPGGVLYGVGPAAGADDFFTINPVTGVASAPIVTDIGPNNISLDFDNNLGDLYGAFFGGGGTVSVWRSMDETTGAVSAPINANIGYHPLSALTAVPEPSTVLLALVGGAFFLMIHRRRSH